MRENPKVTVLMAVRDAGPYLGDAVDSILRQSFEDFEFLIVDDASTDGSAAIAESYRDPRIRLERTGRSLGLAECLNRAMALARGEFVARMDADDVSLPSRLEKQVAHLQSHPECAVVGVKMELMSPGGEPLGSWQEDDLTTTFEEIRRQLPKGNCIAHAGVMVRTDVLRRYRYRPRRSAQDYDLWLRMCADGTRIEKLDERLLMYRCHPDSVSAKRRTNRTALQVNLEIRWRFLLERLRRGQLNRFVWRVLIRAALDQLVQWGRRLKGGVRGLRGRLRRSVAPGL